MTPGDRDTGGVTRIPCSQGKGELPPLTMLEKPGRSIMSGQIPGTRSREFVRRVQRDYLSEQGIRTTSRSRHYDVFGIVRVY
jgi:hypothetical protein